MQKIEECKNVEFETFHREVVPANKPVVIRSLVRDWPAVRQCAPCALQACRYLQSLDVGKPVYTIAAPPSANGRFFYSDDLTELNFKRGQIPLAQVLEQLLTPATESQAHAIAVQSLSVREILPSFESENRPGILHHSVAPTMWIGNQGKVAAHYDVHRNLACVVAGKRHFRLYPPDQISNLYPGPMLNAPGGVPVSLVDAWAPDLAAFPRYAEAQNHMHEAILEPGDAIYIPSLWWHAVASLESFNVLVNYWWGGMAEHEISPNDSLLHAMLAIAKLDPSQRQAWKSYFDYYVFQTQSDPVAHLPDKINDIVTSLNKEQFGTVTEFLASRLKNKN